jgi:hypothetical protein
LTINPPAVRLEGRMEGAKKNPDRPKEGGKKIKEAAQKNPLTNRRKVSIIEGQDGGGAVTRRRNPEIL